MKLKLSYDKEDDVPEAFKELYTEKDGKFLLTGVEGLRTDTDVGKLQDALKKERAAHDKTKQTLKAFEGIDAEKIRGDLDELEELRAVKEAGGNKPDAAKIDRATSGSFNSPIDHR